MLDELDVPVPPPDAQPPRGAREPLPLVAGYALEQQHLAARPLDPDPRRHDACVVDDGERPGRQRVRELAENGLAHLAGRARVDEQARLVTPLRRVLRNQLGGEVVIEL